ncbi:MAG TPA: DNA polymerase III subunit alpha, partial [Candidatus Acidoferrales bacterium]|nr:DNA polymerase III subunit alpha [Candidatus Acidoferrales bacterium]
QLDSLRKTDERVKELVEVALRLEGLARHASTHAAGVVISPRPLTEIVPLYKSNKDEITTQYDMNALERIGLLKMDFLGLTTLTVVTDAVRMIKANRDMDLDLSTLPLDDPGVYALFSRGDTTGIFQFESHGMRDILKRYQPTRLEDLTALNALYRPGPIQGGMIDDFIARKHGKKKVRYDLPELAGILSETWGVILYQEQVMQIANRLAGFSLGDADILRRAMGKKKVEEMAAQREKFLVGCQAHRVPKDKAARIFDLMAEFAGYGFNKSHSCAYALLAYETAWLKVHYPVEFMAAMLGSETGNTDKVVKYINEARGMGITVLPPNVNSSDVDFTPVGDQIRFGLRAIKNVGENTVKGILEARESLGGFKNFFQFCESVDSRLLNKRVMESLIRAGALDGLGANRAQMMEAIDSAMERSQKIQHAREIGQHGLFGGAAAAATAPALEAQALPEVPEWPEHEVLAAEYSVLGFYVSGHPLDKYAGRLQEWKAADLATIEGRRNGEDLAVAGIIVQSRPMRSRQGRRWAILTLQDRSGVIEALVFPEAFGKLEPILKSAMPLLVKARVAVEDVGTRLIVSDARPLERLAAQKSANVLRVRVDRAGIDANVLERLDQLFSSRPGRCRVAFELVDADGSEATIDFSNAVRADEELVERVREICGPEAVAELQ